VVADALPRKRGGERILPVLRLAARAGEAAHVGERFDPMQRQQLEENAQRPRRMPDGPDLRQHDGWTF
jgi:hypothetical protein